MAIAAVPGPQPSRTASTIAEVPIVTLTDALARLTASLNALAELLESIAVPA